MAPAIQISSSCTVSGVPSVLSLAPISSSSGSHPLLDLHGSCVWALRPDVTSADSGSVQLSRSGCKSTCPTSCAHCRSSLMRVVILRLVSPIVLHGLPSLAQDAIYRPPRRSSNSTSGPCSGCGTWFAFRRLPKQPGTSLPPVSRPVGSGTDRWRARLGRVHQRVWGSGQTETNICRYPRYWLLLRCKRNRPEGTQCCAWRNGA